LNSSEEEVCNLVSPPSQSSSSSSSDDLPLLPLLPPPIPPPPLNTPAAVLKEQGHHPDPFTKREDFKLFKRQLLTFFIENNAIYDTELKKILFTLSYMTEGAPGAWAQYQIKQAQTQTTRGNIPNNTWGSWNTFQDNLNTAFADPNKAQNTLNEMETITH
jgi:hypothetical protein